ncbi:ATP-binding cassette domain-containing protein [Yimella sp. RIT 621]|uniref:ATP-binding cassette domain-containing protein n=1 Tax=Yimella sp. RIT 621 TaxID=2510323 RepID=UPI00197ABF84|nr:ATP-binding cassette domain-containing protein [Yimella sp. RIT 621]
MTALDLTMEGPAGDRREQHVAVAIEAERLVKKFGQHVVLDELSFTVGEGTVLGVLGPNGAGKTTAVKAVTGLCALDSGSARILGHSVSKESNLVKQLTGFSGQYAAVDEDLTTMENLVLVGRLYGHTKSDAQRRAHELVEAFDMGSYARKRVAQHSGGMVGTPKVLVLDEPTTGLDPSSRVSLWEMIQGLVGDGMTLLLTTQYLEEADVLADQILVMSKGRQVAFGAPKDLKSRLGGEQVVVELTSGEHDAARAAKVVEGILAGSGAQMATQDHQLSFRVPDASRWLAPCVSALTADGISIGGLSVKAPTLDDVFFALTGDSMESTEPDAQLAFITGGS